MNPDNELQFNRWKEHIFREVGNDQEKILRYLWNLYSSLLSEISEINRQNRTYNFLKNGKNDEGKTSH
jgi:hypothetical protein